MCVDDCGHKRDSEQPRWAWWWPMLACFAVGWSTVQAVRLVDLEAKHKALVARVGEVESRGEDQYRHALRLLRGAGLVAVMPVTQVEAR